QTIVGCAPYMVHSNPTIFPEPDTFIPERWIGKNARQMENYLVAMSKDPRICLGVLNTFFGGILYLCNPLAWCELYLILTNVFRELDGGS
ncbi:hypothetical protein L218DRAFT_876286, partial [Marasmius fiardii PR-910]